MKSFITTTMLTWMFVLMCSCGAPALRDDTLLHTGTSLRIDSVWGEQLDHVTLYFVRQGDESTSCNSLQLMTSTADYMPSCPDEDPCTVKVQRINADPGEQGQQIQLPVGEMNLLAIGFDDSNSQLSHDCVAVSVQEGKNTDIQLNL